jgi:hypothetical protein
MVFEIISILLIIDSLGGLIISFTKVGDNTIEQNLYVRRYMPLTKGWTILYFVLALYVAYLTFGAM